jgi:hypothetical protein
MVKKKVEKEPIKKKKTFNVLPGILDVKVGKATKKKITKKVVPTKKTSVKEKILNLDEKIYRKIHRWGS